MRNATLSGLLLRIDEINKAVIFSKYDEADQDAKSENVRGVDAINSL